MYTYVLICFTITPTITIDVMMPFYIDGSKLTIALHYCCFHKIFYVASGSSVKTTDSGHWFNMKTFVNG